MGEGSLTLRYARLCRYTLRYTHLGVAGAPVASPDSVSRASPLVGHYIRGGQEFKTQEDKCHALRANVKIANLGVIFRGQLPLL